MPIPTDEAVALFTHLGGGLLFGAGVFTAAVVAECARLLPVGTSPVSLAVLLRVGRVGAIASMAGAAVLLAGGLALAGKTNVWAEAWLQASIILFIIALVLGAVGGGRAKRARILAVRLAGDTPASSAALLQPTGTAAEELARLQELLRDPVSRVLNYTSVAIVIVVLALMVWRPGSNE